VLPEAARPAGREAAREQGHHAFRIAILDLAAADFRGRGNQACIDHIRHASLKAALYKYIQLQPTHMRPRDDHKIND
jgi:hypothetical protein